MANKFLDWLNENFKPKSTFDEENLVDVDREWKFKMDTDSSAPFAEFGGQPTYYIGEAAPSGLGYSSFDEENLTEANPPYAGGIFRSGVPEAQVNVGMPIPEPVQVPITRGTMARSMAQARPPLEGTLEPRRPAVTQQRGALPRPALEGEVIRKALGGPGGQPAIQGTRSLPQDPAFARNALQWLTQRDPRKALAIGMLGTPVASMADELSAQYTPPPGFEQPIDYTLGGMFSPQKFDSVSDLLINQYMEGVDPYAKILYERRIRGY